MSFDLLHARVAFRDRPVVDVLDLALRFMTSHGRRYAVISLFAVVPPLAISIAAGRAWGWEWGWAFAIALGAIAQTPFTMLASRLVFEDEVSTKSVLREAIPKSIAMTFARLLAVSLIVAGTSICVLPGIYALAALWFLTEVMLLERAPLSFALTRSSKIATASAGDVFVGFFLLGAITAAAAILADVAGRTVIEEVLQFRPPASLFVDGGSVLALVGFFVAMPYVATARFFTYLNVRTRAEGWDIQTRFAAIAAREAGADAE